MTASNPPRRVGRPNKTVTDEARAAELLEELGRAEHDIREATERRLRLALEASEIGLTTAKIGSAAGASSAAAWKWIQAARDRSTG